MNKLSITCAILMSVFFSEHRAYAAPPKAIFDWVEYRGLEGDKPPPGQYRNPILPGFHPDPSIVRAGNDFYVVNSSFGFFPGLPVLHSRDLVNWRQIGNALDREDQIDLAGVGSQRGIFAPAISFHKGMFYIVTTCVDCGGNFIISARRPEGPWSKPVWLDFEGIDPSLFVDRDGRGWIVNNGEPEGKPAYEGHRAIWIQEFDLAAKKMVGPRKVLVNGGVDFSAKPIWIEGPHIFRKDGWYYMTAAEGGTAADHSQTIFRSRKVTGPYIPGPANPILTQRDLPPNRPFPVTATGHAGLVPLNNGRWASVFLGNRPYEGWLTNLGRETFLLPVQWKNGWPEILPKGVPVPLEHPMLLPAKGTQPDWSFRRDDFDAATLSPDWLSLRARRADQISLTENPGALTLAARAETAAGLGYPSFAGLRQRHHRMSYSTRLRFSPEMAGDRAGLMAFSDEAHHYFFGIERLDSGTHLVVRLRSNSDDPVDGKLLAKSEPIAADRELVTLKIIANGPEYAFHYQLGEEAERLVLNKADGRVLATEYAGLLFTGTVIGPYAARNAF